MTNNNFVKASDRPWIIKTVTRILFAFGVLYAVRIAKRPFEDTWQSVVIGDGATDIASFIVIYALTGDKVAASVPFMNHIISGGPMIIGQILRKRGIIQKNQEVLKRWNGD